MVVNQNKIFILGAGSSVEYGLPTWSSLNKLIEDYLVKNPDSEFKSEILNWISLVGVGKKYDTIDKCIYEESTSRKYKENGTLIENKIFDILEEIFRKIYKENDFWWISLLNEKIRKKSGINIGDIFFINYNYDSVLSNNILNFSYLTQKQRLIDRVRLDEIELISKKPEHYRIPCLYPHGRFEFGENNYLYERIDTIKNHDYTMSQWVSCYDGKEHTIAFSHPENNLYILGLGGGLKINLKKLIFQDNINIANIYITVRKEKNTPEKDYQKNKNEVIDFLVSHYGIQKEKVYVFNDCAELIEKCFSNN